MAPLVALVALVAVLVTAFAPARGSLKEAPEVRTVFAEGFDRSVGRWKARGGTLAHGGDRRGPGVGRATVRARAGFRLSPATPPVRSTRRGSTYRAFARMRTRRPSSVVCLRLREPASGRLVGFAQSCARIGRRWRSPTVAYRAREGGGSLGLALYQPSERPGWSFEIDAVELTSQRRAPGAPQREQDPAQRPQQAPAPALEAPPRDPNEASTGGTRPETPPPLAASSPWPRRARFVHELPGARLPTGFECAQQIARRDWEPRPENSPENETTGAPLVLPDGTWTGFGSWHERARRVNGDFTGTTDEILRWASCKWGFDENLTRAQAVVESNWSQEYLGDETESVGVLQVKAGAESSPHRYTWPHSRTSTAYNVDYAMAWRRACYEGDFAEGGWLPAGSRGDLWNCVGLWYSGRWREGVEEYVARVRHELDAARWRDWGWPDPDGAGDTTGPGEASRR